MIKKKYGEIDLAVFLLLRAYGFVRKLFLFRLHIPCKRFLKEVGRE